MQLQPKRQPGRVDRKVAAYASEIARLRREGYTYAAILEALTDVGIAVSTSALRREMRRLRIGPHAVTPAAPPIPSQSPAPPSFACVPVQALTEDGRSGREIAEAFVRAHPSNPLLKPRVPHE